MYPATARLPEALDCIARAGAIAARSGDALLSGPLNARVDSLGANHPDVLGWRNLQAVVRVYRHKFHEAEAILQDLIASLRTRQNPNDAELAAALHSLGQVLRTIGRLPEALDCFTQVGAIAARTVVPGRENPLLCAAEIHVSLQHYQQAEDLYRKALGEINTQFGAGHPVMADALL